MNLHVPGTNDCVLHEYIEELYIKSIRKPAEHQILEKVVTGCFSERFVSAFFDEFEQNILEKTARAISKKFSEPVLCAWLFDSDVVGFHIYSSGKKIAEYIYNPDGYSKLGNLSLFCEALGLEKEDEARLRAIFKKGSAEEQLDMTARLIGAPFYADVQMLPHKKYVRDVKAVDQWIAERPKPQKIVNTTKAEIIQKIPQYRFCYHLGKNPFYGREEPFDDRFSCNEIQLWDHHADGTLSVFQSIKHNAFYCMFFGSEKRLLVVSQKSGTVVFDSAGLLPKDYPAKGSPSFLPDGGILWKSSSGVNQPVTLIRCAADGSQLYRKEQDPSFLDIFGFTEKKIIVIYMENGVEMLRRMDSLTGECLEESPAWFGFNVWNKQFRYGCWWLTHSGLVAGNSCKKSHTLTKYDETLHPLADLPLPDFTQDLCFSPDGVYLYVFIFKNSITVVNTETMKIEHVLSEKSFFSPLGFDEAGRFWLQHDNNTAEAWDALLQKPFSRHKLKGTIYGHHTDEQGRMCVVTWNEKENTLRVYRLE